MLCYSSHRVTDDPAEEPHRVTMRWNTCEECNGDGGPSHPPDYDKSGYLDPSWLDFACYACKGHGGYLACPQCGLTEERSFTDRWFRAMFTAVERRDNL